jgi:hypothetical protein
MGTTIVCALVALATGTLFGLGAGFLGGHGYAHRLLRYRDPQLHNGKWDLKEVVNGNVMWLRQDQEDGLDLTHTHRAQVCQIMRGLAHVDTCTCGSRRYGVFGSWS